MVWWILRNKLFGIYQHVAVTDEWESCSSEDEDEDSDGSWIDVHHSSDEEQASIMP